MWIKYKTVIIAVAIALAVGALAGYMLGSRGDANHDAERSAAISGQLREEIANNQRLAAKNAELERINKELGRTIEIGAAESSELRIELEESQRIAAAAAANNRYIEAGLQEARDLDAADLGRILQIRQRAQRKAQ